MKFSAPLTFLVISLLSVGYLTLMALPISCSTSLLPLPDRTEPVDNTASTMPDETPLGGVDEAGDGAYEVNTGPCPGYCGCPGSCGVNGQSGGLGKAGGLGNVLR